MQQDPQRAFDALKVQAMTGILQTGGVEIRDVDGGEEPFIYSTKNKGPGYVDIKGRVGFHDVFDAMTRLLHLKLVIDKVAYEMIVGMMTGGAIPAFRIAQLEEQLNRRPIIYVYQRGARKEGGHGELDTGDRNNPAITKGIKAVVIEELVNFAGTTCNGVAYERSRGRTVTDAACILFYENPIAISRLKKNGITLHYPISLPELLHFGLQEGLLAEHLVRQYRNFLKDPKGWNESRGYTFYPMGA